MIYSLCRWILQLIFHARLDITVEGIDNLPPAGPAILVANHPCALDGLLLISIIPRRLRGFSRADNFDSFYSAILLRALGAFAAATNPRDRAEVGDNLRSLEQAERWLRQGEIFASAPEGGVNTGLEMQPFRWGFMYLASELGVPVIPVAIVGSGGALFDPRTATIYHLLTLRRACIRVAILEPVHFEPRAVGRATIECRVEHVRQRLRGKILELRRTKRT